MMRYGIPEYRLPKEVLEKEIQIITGLCQNVFCNKALGRDFTVRQLRQMGFDAVFVGIGSWTDQRLGLPGEQLAGVYSGIEFLRQVAMKNQTTVGKRVVVIGGGNTAMDAARTAVRLGAEEVTVVYRRSRKEMPASPHEIEQAAEEGVQFALLTNPVAFVGETGKVQAIQCVKMELGTPDSSGRRRPVPVAGSEFELPADMAITATGQKLDQGSLSGSPEVKVTARCVIQVDKSTLQGDTEWIFSGGDCVTGPATVVEAVAAGRKAAYSIDCYLKGHVVAPAAEPFNISRGSLKEMDPAEFTGREKISRTPLPTLQPAERKKHFQEFEHGFTQGMAQREAGRCLSCGCLDVFTCRLREYATKFQADAARFGKGVKRHAEINDHPYIISDPNKCILCGNCVRLCQEIQGTSALGFVNRGSETVVLPALRSPLAETLCSSCGQCADICPTGALSKRSNLAKPGPWQVQKVATTCPHCSIGCQVVLHTAGGQMTGVTSQGDLCNKGFTGYNGIRSAERLDVPLLRKNGKLEQAEWDEALTAAWKLLAQVRNEHGLDSVAVVISPNATNEESYLAYKLGRMVLGTNQIFSTVPLPAVALTGSQRGLQPSFTDIQNSDLLLVIGGELTHRYPVIAHKIKKAVDKGATLLLIDPHVTGLDRLAKMTLKVSRQKMQRLFEAFASYLLQYGMVDQETALQHRSFLDCLEDQLVEDYVDILRDFRVKPDKIIQFIHRYRRARNPVIIVDGQRQSQDELELLRTFALMTGNLGQPGRGILALYPYSNVHGLLDLGIKTAPKDWELLWQGIKNDRIKGLFILGEAAELDERFWQGVKAVVITPSLSKNLQADVILPGSTFGETGGTITNSEGRIQRLFPALPSPAERETWQVLLGLAYQSGYFMNYSMQEVYGEMINQRIKS
ncbi:molybdopterin-dependent oxidoreductase [Desulforamulus profundi]|uniref:molybdopterin-dependent oxidoreductase n=1 Tax=Desulforamulus profundi TaxID=1383067 RepID=UPI001EE5429E|nr:molybdopterin-dependent oxidoreductase [Desulforamulus profundi]